MKGLGDVLDRGACVLSLELSGEREHQSNVLLAPDVVLEADGFAAKEIANEQ